MKSDLRTIPGVGPNMEEHLLRLGVSSVASLRGQDPEELYERDCVLHGGVLDRCVLYVYLSLIHISEPTRRS